MSRAWLFTVVLGCLVLLLAQAASALVVPLPLPGVTPEAPLLPETPELRDKDAFNFFFFVDDRQRFYIDPEVAIGYDYQVLSGPLFRSVLLPSVGDNKFDLYLWNESDWAFIQQLNAGVAYDFVAGAGVDRFRIRGIETSAGLDPADPTAFVTGLTFTSTGEVHMLMTPIVEEIDDVIPEPVTVCSLLLGLGGVVGYVRRRRAA